MSRMIYPLHNIQTAESTEKVDRAENNLDNKRVGYTNGLEYSGAVVEANRYK